MKLSSKMVIVPVFVALAVSMSACDRDANTGSKTADITETTTTGSESGDTGSGGIGMTYNGKIGIEMGGGLVMPIGGGSPQLGYGF
jgi:hypothetical protein